MSDRRLRRAFTLIEVLIVVVILAVLAGIMIQHVVVSTDDAKRSTLVHNLYVLRAQIEMYKLNHNGAVPGLQSNSLPQLTSATNSSGTIGASGPNFPFGPYVAGGQFPANPFDQKNTVTSTAVFPPTASTSAGGWLYHEATGRIAANTDGHLDD
jgi:general secretion pathway protein G